MKDKIGVRNARAKSRGRRLAGNADNILVAGFTQAHAKILAYETARSGYQDTHGS
jgi:hypothetical protein